ncbi:AfsR/SARP family transcriptional regulator [Amycolatopsis magusensis]|uniref:AfsR/SARP family transcriptional regulator n=1 Tax=Amycolatopsis magusensis TaxID=882444 RepID=UPI003790F3E0
MGPLEITGVPSGTISAGRQRCLLAMLLLEPGQVVPLERIADALWGEDWPDTVRNAVQVVVSRLRRSFAGHPVQILARANGYLIDVPPSRVDLHRFRAWVAKARELAWHDDATAAELFQRALCLWRGAPMAGVESELISERIAPALEHERVGALLDYHDAVLRLDRAAELVPALLALTHEHPFEQRLWAQLMIALHRTGRTRDALAAYRRLHRRLGRELGLEPTAELKALEQAVLRGDSLRHQPVRQHRTPRREAFDGPAQLPPTVGDFTGRTAELDELVRTLTAPGEAVPVVTLAGQGGVGKTTLAVRAAHLVTEHFPDGQLYVDLCGTQDAVRDPARVLANFLLSLGVDGGAIPDDLADRSALFRSKLAGRKVLVLLDNAADEEQVRPLLPGSAGCAVVVTSRARLSGLEGGRSLDVEVFTPEQAWAFLAGVVGQDRIDAEPGAVAEITRLCGYLPLAVRVAGAKLVARSRLGIGQLAARLADECGRLDELVAGDLAVRASLALSYTGLRPEEQRALRLLGLLDVTDFASWVCAAVLDVSAAEAESTLDALVDVHLVEVVGIDVCGRTRYRLHDLTRLFARERAEESEPPQETEAALGRARTAWLALAEAADDLLDNRTLERISNCPDRERLAAEEPEILGGNAAGWFDVEARNLQAIVAGGARGPIGWQIAEALVGYFEYRVLGQDWERTHLAALERCEAEGDRLGAAVLLRGLADRAWGRGSADCLRYARKAERLFAELGHDTGRSQALSLLGLGLRLEGAYDESMAAYAESRRLSGEQGKHRTTIMSLINESIIHRVRGEADQALRCVLEVRRLAGAIGFARAEAEAWMRLGNLRQDRGQWDEAVDAYRTAAAGFRRLDHAGFHTLTLTHLGDLHLRTGDLHSAEDTLEQAVEAAANYRHHSSSFLPMELLAEVHLEQGRYDLAAAELTGYVAEYRERRLVARLPGALAKLGRARHGTGQVAEAVEAWTEARALHLELGNRAGAAELDELLGGITESTA